MLFAVEWVPGILLAGMASGSPGIGAKWAAPTQQLCEVAPGRRTKESLVIGTAQLHEQLLPVPPPAPHAAEDSANAWALLSFACEEEGAGLSWRGQVEHTWLWNCRSALLFPKDATEIQSTGTSLRPLRTGGEPWRDLPGTQSARVFVWKRRRF